MEPAAFKSFLFKSFAKHWCNIKALKLIGGKTIVKQRLFSG